MSYSETQIANLALVPLGEAPINSFEDDNTPARLVSTFYPMSRDYVLSRGNWSFARKTELLRQVAEDHPRGYVFALPSDCLAPRFLYPRANMKSKWEVEGQNLILPTVFAYYSEESTLYLVYTRYVKSTALFTVPFVHAVAADLTARLMWPITHDSKAAKDARQFAEFTIEEQIAEDARRGSQYRDDEENPDNDKWVNLDAGQMSYGTVENS